MAAYAQHSCSLPAHPGDAVVVERLSKNYGRLLAVDHISFTVRPGEFFGFLGPNGAGKTTTVRMLTGVVRADEGQARVMGHPAGSIAAKQLSGVVPELSNAYQDLSGWGNLMLMAELYRLPKISARERAERLLHALELHDRKDDLVKAYSMGMRRRLIVAAALLPEPRIVFLDEPTSGLDVRSARAVRGFLRELRQSGTTIFLTTHNMDEAAELCDRVGIIHRGRLVALDSPDSLRISAGRLSLVDVCFERFVPAEELTALAGVQRLEDARAMAAAEQMCAQAAKAGKGLGQEPGTGCGRGGVAADSPPMSVSPAAEHRVRLYTEDTTLLLGALVDFSRARSLGMRIVQLRAPSLEEAFVRLTEGGGT